jgi:hypothetical protein
MSDMARLGRAASPKVVAVSGLCLQGSAVIGPSSFAGLDGGKGSDLDEEFGFRVKFQQREVAPFET